MSNLLESLPIIMIYLLILVSMLVFIEIGYRFGINIRSRNDKEASNHIGPVVGGLIGMLAFLLAFTFNTAYNQHVTRQLNVLLESNAIGTAYNRAELVDKHYGKEIKSLLGEYVDIRMKFVEGKINLVEALKESEKIHILLWKQITKLSSDQPTVVTSLLIQSINKVIDLHDIRVTDALYNLIHPAVGITLLIITMLSMLTMGYQMGLTGKRRFYALIALSIAFTMLISLIVDLNSPGKGFIQVNQRTMKELQIRIHQLNE